ncbi:glycolate oxidase subunit GlcE [Roseateles sp. BYS180W]|uniref:Glycolate oxidase subunit GlcE n=1 Tax=Roseateles rivi TaxID=3299028 RepID=A0ABW7FQR6_9BURK
MLPYPIRALQERIRAAAAEHQTLRIVGHGSKDFWGAAPAGEPLSTRELSGIGAYEPSELVVTVGAGTPLVELEAALAQCGQVLAFEPPRLGPPERSGTVGGMVASGLAGPARLASGGVRDHVLGVQLLNGRAELLRFGGTVMKNVAGFDVSRVMAGSWGALGLLVEVSLKVLPQAPAQRTLCFELTQAQALAQLVRWSSQALPLQASAWEQGVLRLRLAGAAAAVQTAAARLGGDSLPEAQASAYWQSLRDQQHPWFEQACAAADAGAQLWRLSLPPGTAELPLEAATLLEWHGCQRWLLLPPTQAPAPALQALAASLGGQATLYRCSDRSLRRAQPLGAVELRLQQNLLEAFDPDRVFHAGRLHDEL